MLTRIKVDVYFIPVLVGIVCLILFKLPHLYLPYYADEAWSYAPAIKIMAQNGPSLLPGAISADYTRGHPLLFYFLSSSWIRLFGDSNFSLHSFALLISVLLVLAVYFSGKKFLNKEGLSYTSIESYNVMVSQKGL